MLKQPFSQWPEVIWLVRHGQSAGNIARDKAHAAGVARIEIDVRDVDVPLSKKGCEQAAALGDWFGAMPADRRPDVILSSPYVRAIATAESIRSRLGAHPAPDLIIDERLREKEFGILEGLTRQGIQQFFPEQAELRRQVGKFYHRPPGGESWCDVILRLRSAVHTMSLHHVGRRVLVVGHQVLVLCFRYLLENLTESELLAIDGAGDVANCSVSEYRCAQDGGQALLKLHRYNWILPLQEAGAAVTAQPDAATVGQS